MSGWHMKGKVWGKGGLMSWWQYEGNSLGKGGLMSGWQYEGNSLGKGQLKKGVVLGQGGNLKGSDLQTVSYDRWTIIRVET